MFEEFTFDASATVLPNVTLFEGLDQKRMQTVRRGLHRTVVHFPYLARLGQERGVKRSLFPDPSMPRDPVADLLGSLANRRAVITDTLSPSSEPRPETTVLNVNLLTTFSMLKDPMFSVERWVDFVVLAFNDCLPGQIVWFSQHNSRGKVQPYEKRPLPSIQSDVNRRMTALTALTRRISTIRVLELSSDTHPDSEFEQVNSFLFDTEIPR